MSAEVLPFVIIAAALVVTVGVMLVILRVSLVRCPPDAVIVIQGRRHRGRGFKVVSGPRVLVVPVIEQASVLSLAPRPVKVELDRVLTADSQHLRLEASGFVGVLKEEPAIYDAVERFLGRPDEEIARVARETLEGTWRQAVASAPLATLVGDLERTNLELEIASAPELAKLGLGLLALDRFRLRDASGKTWDGGFDRRRAAEVARRARGEAAARGGRRY